MIRTHLLRWTFLVAAAFLAAGCSGTTLSGSWKDPGFERKINTVYLVGISKSETNRRLFETRFAEELATHGVTGLPSYRDLPDASNAGREAIDAAVRKRGADSVLITRLVSTRTEEVVTPGRVSGYRSWPYRGYPYPSRYRYWGSYYDRCCLEMTYEPPTVTRYEIATVEANLYEAASGELVWSAQLETVIESDLRKLVDDFIDTVTRDLREQGVI
ncbi:MAG: DUF4136 domain-containing protein [Deltaproteobacteria bacterium]|nr:MAG: DUF4136 domain-containing protein [Deltaproteobacteria bacterium]